MVRAESGGDGLEVTLAVVVDGLGAVGHHPAGPAQVQLAQRQRAVSPQVGDPGARLIADLEDASGEIGRPVDVSRVEVVGGRPVQHRGQPVIVAQPSGQFDGALPDAQQLRGAVALHGHHRVAEELQERGLERFPLGGFRNPFGHRQARTQELHRLLVRAPRPGAPAPVEEQPRGPVRVTGTFEVAGQQLGLQDLDPRVVRQQERGDAGVHRLALPTQHRVVEHVAQEHVTERVHALGRFRLRVDHEQQVRGDEDAEVGAGIADDALQEPPVDVTPEGGRHPGGVGGIPQCVEPGEQDVLERGRHTPGQALIAHRGGELLEEQGDPLGPRHHGVDHRRIRAVAGSEELLDQPAGLVLVQVIEDEDVVWVGPDALQFVAGARRGEHPQPAVPTFGEVPEDLTGRCIRPVHVLGDHTAGAAGRRDRQQIRERGQGAAPAQLPVAAGGQTGFLEPVEQLGPVDPVRLRPCGDAQAVGAERVPSLPEEPEDGPE